MSLQPYIARIATQDGLYLHGFFQPGDPTQPALLHIHGLEGNFYDNHFLDFIAPALAAKNITWLPVNTRGNGTVTNFDTVSGNIRTIGAQNELLEEAYLDIDAWIEFLLAQGFSKIVLMGHSLGTYKAVRYLSEGKHANTVTKLILLSPFDKKAALAADIQTPLVELLTRAEKMVAEGKGKEVITPEFDTINLSYQTYVSWYQQDELGRCFEFCSPDYHLPALQKIQVPTKIIVGSKDEFFHLSNPENPQEAMDKMLQALPHAEGVIIPGAVHSFAPHEDVLAKEIAQFIEKS